MKKTILLTVLCFALLFTVSYNAEAVGNRAAESDTVTMLVTGNPAIIDWNTNAMSLWMQEVTGLRVNYRTIPLTGRAEALSLELASRNYPDAFMAVGMNENLINRFGVIEGRLLPLNDLIAQHAPNLQRIFRDNPGYRERVTMTDGNIYTMPNVNQCYHCTMYTKMWINQDFLNRVGLPIPTTTDELLVVLRAFRDMDANGNGNRGDEIPFAAATLGGWGNYMEYFIMNSFTFYEAHLLSNSAVVNSLGLYVENGTVKTPWFEPGFLQGLRYMNQLFREGLLYEGSFTMDDTALVNLVESGPVARVGMAPGGYAGIFSETGGARYQQFVPLMPLRGPSGLRQIPKNVNDLNFNGFLISADVSHERAVQLVRWADRLYEFDATMNAYFGPSATHWRLARPGEMGLDDNPAIYAPLVPWQETDPQNDHWVQMTIGNRDAAFRAGELFDSSIPLYSAEGLERLLFTTTLAMEPYANYQMVMPQVKLTEAQTTATSVPITDIRNLLMRYVYGFINGTYNIDTEFNGFLQQLRAAGIEGVVQVYQTAYNEQFR